MSFFQFRSPQFKNVPPAGSGPHNYTQNLTANLQLTGAQTKSTARSLTGALQLTGSAIKATTKAAFTAGLSFAGAITKQARKVLTGSVSLSGAVTKATGHILSAGLSLAGSTIKATAKTFTAALSLTGSLTRALVKLLTLTASLQLTGAITKQTRKALSGGLSLAGNNLSPRSIVHILSGGLQLTGSAVKATTKTPFTAGLSLAGAIIKQPRKALAGALSFSVSAGGGGSGISDSYSETNASGTMGQFAGNQQQVAQSFTAANSANLVASKFYLKKTGSPTGNITSYLYAHSGTYGSSSLPTGAALATSNTVNIASLTTSLALVEFDFPTPFAMTAGTQYCIAIEFAGGSVSNTLNTADGTANPHGGNNSTFNGTTWAVFAGGSVDTCFYVLDDSGSTPPGFLKLTNKALTAGLSLTGSLVKAITHGLTASLALAGSLTKKTAKIFTAALQLAGAITTNVTHGGTLFTQTLTASLSLSGAVTKRPGKLFTGGLSLMVSPGSTGPVISDSYSETNQDHSLQSQAGFNPFTAQSFTAANTANLVAAKFYLKKVGSPTGNITAYLFAHSGTFGTSSVPGSVLATSNTVDISTLSTSYALVEFDFPTPFAMTAGTHYDIGLGYPSGDGSNNLNVGYHLTGGSATGNAATGTTISSWAAQTWDECFYVYDDSATTLPGFIKAVSKALVGGLSLTGSIKKAVTHTLTASLQLAGSITKATTKAAFTAALQLTGALTRIQVKLLTLTAALQFTGSTVKQSNKTLAGGLNLAGAIKKATTHLLAAGLSLAGNITKAVSHRLTASLQLAGGHVAGVLRKLTLTASLSLTGAVTKLTGKQLGGGLALTGSYRRQVGKQLAGGVNLAGSMTRRTAHGLTAALSYTGTLAKRFPLLLTASLRLSGNLVVTNLGFIAKHLFRWINHRGGNRKPDGPSRSNRNGPHR